MSSVELAPTSQVDRVFLDRVGDACFQLTEVLSHARVVLRGFWELLKDEASDGLAVVGQDAAGEPQFAFVEDKLGKDIYTNEQGERFVVVRVGGQITRHQSLDARMCRYKDADIELAMGNTSAASGMVAYIMAHARSCEQRVHWGLFHLYGLLALTTFAGKRCKWTNAGLPAWTRLLQPHLGKEHFIFSKHWNLGAEKMDSLPWWQRCLPELAVSSVGLLRLLSQWAFCSFTKGGFKAEQSCRAAKEMLESLLRYACTHGDGQRFSLVVNASWVCRWPRPSVVYEEGEDNMVQLSLAAPNLVDTAALFEPPTSDSPKTHKLQQQWVGLLMRAGIGPGNARLPVGDLLKVLAQQQALSSLSAQVCWHCSLHLESALAASNKQGGTLVGCPGFGFRSSVLAVGDLDMEEKLYLYTKHSKTESSHHRICSLATDKANPCFLPLQNSLLSWPSGIAVVCCPQVESCSHS